MVRTYATIFCDVAEAAYHQKIEMETTLSFLGALRGLGAIGHIVVQDTMAKLRDGHFKNLSYVTWINILKSLSRW